MGEQCIPHNGVQGELVCECCSRCKAGCLHVGPSASATPYMNVAGWHAAVHEGVALIVDVMDHQMEVLGELASEVHGLRQIVECLSSSSASSLRGAGSGGDMGQESAWDEDEEVWVGDGKVELQMRGEGEESSDMEEGADDEGGTEPEASTTPWWPCVPCPRMKVWKGKGKATEKGKGKGKGKMY